MAFLNSPRRIRFHTEQENKIEELMKKYPGRFDSISHVVRCAINNFYKQEMKAK